MLSVQFRSIKIIQRYSNFLKQRNIFHSFFQISQLFYSTVKFAAKIALLKQKSKLTAWYLEKNSYLRIINLRSREPMRYFYAILLLVILTHLDVNAQRVRLGERLPDVKVESEFGTRLQDTNKDFVCLVFINSHSKPCIDEVRKIDPNLLYDMELILVTQEQPNTKDEITSRLGTSQYSIAFDIEDKTFRSFGIRYVPFCVIYKQRNRRIEWFGPTDRLVSNTYCN